MATWEDGPEYAPRERPQYFADAPVPPLEQAPPTARPADGLPAARPRFDEPEARVAPLAELVPRPPDERDPHRPFDVVTATLTSESAWGSSPAALLAAAVPPAEVPAAAVPASALPATSGPAELPGPAVAAPSSAAPPAPGVPWPVLEPPAGPAGFPAPGGPAGPSVPPPSGFPPAAPRGPYPEPGTPGWFAPPPATYGEQQQPGRPGARAVFDAATPGLCICLALGGLVLPLAPVMLVVAIILSTRVRVAQAAVRVVFRGAGAALAFFAVVGLVRSAIADEPWWGFVSTWSVVLCWLSLVLLLGLVWNALRRAAPPAAGPPPGPWG